MTYGLIRTSWMTDRKKEKIASSTKGLLVLTYDWKFPPRDDSKREQAYFDTLAKDAIYSIRLFFSS